MTDEAMSPLRRRMIEDMTIRKLAPKTQQGYVRTIKSFAVFLGRSPDTAIFEDVRRLQLYLAANGAGHAHSQSHCVGTAVLFSSLRSSDTPSSSTRRLSMSRGSCRWCSVRRRWRGCSMRRQGSSTRRPCQRHLPVMPDANEGIGREGARAGGRGAGVSVGRETLSSSPPPAAAPAAKNVRRSTVPVVCAACLLASRIRG